ncbi:UNVERIFIED_CONTAM: hypothetical protein Slati_2658100 [Sesamum latifolium]|uniref:Uncharacterized protein n=1 Tax=Sesamum latifolium TaxID=2727402 RepID=A0AAW2VUX2_9LAMI
MALNEKLHVHDDGEKGDPSLYRKLIETLLYLNTRSHITHSVSLFSKFMNEPSKTHFVATKES